MKINYKYLLGGVILFIVEAIIAIYIHDQFIRPFVGDMLVVILLYMLLKSFITKPIPYLPWWTFAFAVLVELGQLIHILEIFHLEDSRLLRIICGTAFDIKDILCYFIGTMIIIFGNKTRRYIIADERKK